MNEFTKEELECLENAIQLQLAEKAMSQINYDRRVALRQKLQSMIDNYCEHEWRCWDDQHNTRECIKCGEERTGAITEEE